MKLNKKADERVKAGLAKFKKILAIAKDRDLNESDTVAIINDMLSEVFGYEKYSEITSELMIRGTYCDLAIRINEKFEDGYLIECKRVGCDLKEEHMRQAVNYGVNKGIKWVILTNGIEWRIYKLKFEQPVSWDLVVKFDVLQIDYKNEADVEKLVCLTKEGVLKSAREEMYEKVQCVNKYVIGQIICQDVVLSVLRKELKKMSDGVNVDEDEIKSIITASVLRRDILDAEEAEVQKASQKVMRFYKSLAKKVVVQKKPEEVKVEEKKPEEVQHLSITEQLLAEAESKAIEQQQSEADGAMDKI